MKRQQIIDIAAQIDACKQVPGKFCETIFNVEEILAFATVYKLSVHFTISSRFEAKTLPSIDLFSHDKIED